MKKAIFRIVVLAILGGAAYAGYRYFKQGPQKVSAIATAKVQRGDVVIRAYTRGELRTVRTYPLYAPALNGTIRPRRTASQLASRMQPCEPVLPISSGFGVPWMP